MPTYTNDDLNAASSLARLQDTLTPYRTLNKRVAKGKSSIFRTHVRRGPAPLLFTSAEECLVEWIIGRQRVGHPASRKDVIFKATAMSALSTGQNVGGGWYCWFMDRHPTLAPRISQTVSKARNSVTKDDTVRLFYSLIKAVVENDMDASRVFNMDETAFQTNKGSKCVVAVRGSKNVWHQNVMLNFHLTLVACGSAAGVMMPPLFVLPGATVKLQVLNECGIPGAAVTTSSIGLMNGSLFVGWLPFFAKACRKMFSDLCCWSWMVARPTTLWGLVWRLISLVFCCCYCRLTQRMYCSLLMSFKAKLRTQSDIYVG